MPFDPDQFLKETAKRPKVKPRPPPEEVIQPRQAEGSRLAKEIGTGITKGGAALGYGAAELGGTAIDYLKPNLGRALRQIPGLAGKIKELNKYAESKSSGMPESVAKFLTELAPLAMVPGAGEEAMALGLTAKGLDLFRAAPTIVKSLPVRNLATGRMMKGPITKIPGALPSWGPAAMRTAGALGRGAEAAQKGAVAGAVTDPNDPLTGAAEGALGGIASRAVPAVARAAAPYAAYAAAPAIWGHGYHAPIWSMARKLGDVAGSVAGKVSPPAGYGIAEARGNYLSDLARKFTPSREPIAYEEKEPIEYTNGDTRASR